MSRIDLRPCRPRVPARPSHPERLVAATRRTLATALTEGRPPAFRPARRDSWARWKIRASNPIAGALNTQPKYVASTTHLTALGEHDRPLG